MSKIKKGVQILAVTKNKAGMLAEVAQALAAAKVNIQAISAYAIENQAYFRILTSDHTKAKAALTAKGYQTSLQEVLMLELPNRVGALEQAGQKLKKAQIDLSYIYGTTCSAQEDCLLVLNSDNNEQAIKALAG